MPLATFRTCTLAVLGTLALSGCALDQLRVEEAKNVATTGKVAVAATRDYLAKVAVSREATNLEFVSLDAACAPNEAYLWMSPRIKKNVDIKAQPKGWLCAPDFVEGRTSRLSLSPPGRDLLPALQTLDGLAHYFAAITRIVEQSGPTTSSDVAETAGLLKSAGDLTAAGVKGVPLPSDDQVKAVVALIALLDKIQREADQVRVLRTLIANDNSTGELIGGLRSALADWEAARAADADTRTTNSYFLMKSALNGNTPPPADIRRQLVKDYYGRASAEIDDGKMFPLLDGTLEELASADRDMRNALKENPNLTAKQRHRLAQLTRARITAALDALTALITSFAKV